jgi:phosphatidylglycerophosphate synthase
MQYVDGMVAVEGGFRTKSGEIFNELPDRFADVFVPGRSGPYSWAGRMGSAGWLVLRIARVADRLRADARCVGRNLAAFLRADG